MIIIVKKHSNKVIDNLGSNNAFPDGNIPRLKKLEEDQKYIRIHDNSEIAKQINSAVEYDLTLDKDDNVVSVKVKKTREQWEDEQPPAPKTNKELAIEALKLINLESTDIADVLKRLEIIEEYLKIKE